MDTSEKYISTNRGWLIQQKDLPKNVNVNVSVQDEYHGHGHGLHGDHESASVHPLQQI